MLYTLFVSTVFTFAGEGNDTKKVFVGGIPYARDEDQLRIELSTVLAISVR